MKRFALVLIAIILTAGTAMAQITDLIISEYVEGSSNNKAVEIFNGSGNDIALGDYSLLLYANGNTSPIYTIALDAVTLNQGDAFVLVNSNASAALALYANQLSGSLTFNGDDALVLTNGSEVVDSIGTVGFDPGSGWICDQGSTVNHTMRRKTDICQGDTDPSDVFDVCMEWNFFAMDTFDNLGLHNTDCESVSNRAGSWGTLKAIYR